MMSRSSYPHFFTSLMRVNRRVATNRPARIVKMVVITKTRILEWEE